MGILKLIVNRHLLKIGLMFALLFAPIHSAYSKDKIVIGGLEAPPYIIVGKDKQVSGILIDLITQTLSNMDIEPVFEITNWARAFANAKNGKIDALIPTIKSADREEFFVFPKTPLVNLEMVLIKKSVRNLNFSGNLNELKGYNIGRIRNARVSPKFDDAAQQNIFQIQERSSFGLLALGVARGRFDLMAGDELMGLWGAATQDVLDQVEVVHPHLNNIPVFFALSKHSPYADRVKQFSEHFSKVQISSHFEKTLTPYTKLLKKNVTKHLLIKSLD